MEKIKGKLKVVPDVTITTKFKLELIKDKKVRVVLIESPDDYHDYSRYYYEFEDGSLVEVTNEESPMKMLFDLGVGLLFYDDYTGPWKTLEEFYEARLQR